MRKNLGPLPAVYPMPVLIVAAYDENGVPCAMNAAWGMISDMDRITLFIDSDHKTTKNIQASRAFTVAIADRDHMAEADFVGIASGNDMPEKFKKSGLTEKKSAFVNAPVIDQFPLTMECEFDEVIRTAKSHAIVGKIINVSVDESVLDENGKVDALKLNALMFDNFTNGYYVTGERVGKAWNAGKELMRKAKAE